MNLYYKGGLFVMREQEHYKQMLQKVISDTEARRIETPDELVRLLIDELSYSHELGQ